MAGERDESTVSSQATDNVLSLARELRRVRAETGVSLKELERATASSDSSLSRYLAGISAPPWAVVEALCRAAHRNPQDLADVWQTAQRSRVERRGLAKIDGQQAAKSASHESERATPGAEISIVPKRSRRLILAFGACCTAAAATIVIARPSTIAPSPSLPMALRGDRRRSSQRSHRQFAERESQAHRLVRALRGLLRGTADYSSRHARDTRRIGNARQLDPALRGSVPGPLGHPFSVAFLVNGFDGGCARDAASSRPTLVTAVPDPSHRHPST